MSIYEEHKARYEFEMADPYRCGLVCEELDKDSCPICNPLENKINNIINK